MRHDQCCCPIEDDSAPELYVGFAMFTQGHVYRRRDLHDRYGGQRQGGISTPSQYPIILLFTGESGEQHGLRMAGLRMDSSSIRGKGSKAIWRLSVGMPPYRIILTREKTSPLCPSQEGLCPLPWTDGVYGLPHPSRTGDHGTYAAAPLRNG